MTRRGKLKREDRATSASQFRVCRSVGRCSPFNIPAGDLSCNETLGEPCAALHAYRGSGPRQLSKDSWPRDLSDFYRWSDSITEKGPHLSAHNARETQETGAGRPGFSVHLAAPPVCRRVACLEKSSREELWKTLQDPAHLHCGGFRRWGKCHSRVTAEPKTERQSRRGQLGLGSRRIRLPFRGALSIYLEERTDATIKDFFPIPKLPLIQNTPQILGSAIDGALRSGMVLSKGPEFV
jgi:hypothetical protein